MKNGIFQALIALAVVALFILHFTDGGNAAASNQSAQTTADTTAGNRGSVVFVRLDSLLNKYELHRRLSAQLDEKGRRLQADLAQREQNVMAERQALQEYAPSLSAAQLRQAQQDYQRVENNYLQYQQRVMTDYQAEQDSLTAMVQDDLKIVIKELQAEMDFDYVLQHEATLLYGEETLDITSLLVQRLNAKAKEETAAAE